MSGNINMSRADATRHELRLALLRLQHGRPQRIKPGRKLSIAAVAEEAGITPAAIHNHYPDMAEEIRTLTRRGLRQQRDAKRAELQVARQRIRELDAEIAQLMREVEKLASENLSLLSEN
jgi:AcrR family transcriptional regulator